MSRKIVFSFLGVAVLVAAGLLAKTYWDGEPARDRATTSSSATHADLSEADRAAAEKQKNCPVSGEVLGYMGAPVKVTVKGRDVYLCCSGCKGKLLNDPDKYIAKLDKNSPK